MLKHILSNFFRTRIYLDAAASTPLSKTAFKAMRPYLSRHFGNPGSVHREGSVGKQALKAARGEVARALSVRPEEITFTSGGTEANNLAVVGVVQSYMKEGRSPESMHVLTTALEHSSVLACVKELQNKGVKVDYIPVTTEGVVDLEAFSKLLREETVLVSVHYVNGEVGVIQPLRDMARVLAEFKDRHSVATPWFHTDASQAPLYLDCALEHLGVDLMTLDGQKIYGPKGVGVLAHRRKVPLTPHIMGGGQESGLRSGTEPIPLIVGFSSALKEACRDRELNSKRIGKLRDVLHEALKKRVREFEVNGSITSRVPNNLNISIRGVDTEYLVIRLDGRGVAASTRSACEGQSVHSHVVEAMTHDLSRAQSTLRLTLPLEISRSRLLRAASIIGEEVIALTRSH